MKAVRAAAAQSVAAAPALDGKHRVSLVTIRRRLDIWLISVRTSSGGLDERVALRRSHPASRVMAIPSFYRIDAGKDMPPPRGTFRL
ncbi:hypothetical protein [Cupriavidus basilensis]|uniref:hypothetical protein n=1 Tax=Cupriavidus basilensis TaxID=68895 RepID=UPI0023E8B8D1|nr:hypothetical protein [Cupriavidus basilensis]MDF3888840.1 hypothetical protein [Cupriavidus basilensis]